MTFSLRNLRSFVFGDLVAGFGSKNHGRRKGSSRKGRYSYDASELPEISSRDTGRTVAVLHVVAYERSAINEVNA